MPPNARPGDRAMMHLVVGDRHATLCLTPDPDRRERALAHGRGHALSYLDRALEPPLRDVVLDLARAFAAQGGPDSSTAEVVETLRALLPPETRLHWRRTLPASQVIPRWPITLRGGPPPPLDRGLWPFDPEVAGLLAGTRRLVKRDWLTSEQRETDAAWLASHGLALGTAAAADSPDRHVLFAATDEATLARAAEAEAALGAPGAARDEAASWLGQALGYPPCCQAAFGRLGRRDDLTLAADLLPPVDAPAAAPLTQWLHGPLALVSHTPCSLGCPATLDLAARLLSELDRQRPGFALRWETLARAVQAIDVTGRCYTLRGPGGPARIEVQTARELCVPATGDLRDLVQPAPHLEGLNLTARDQALVGPGFRAVLVADHRGA